MWFWFYCEVVKVKARNNGNKSSVCFSTKEED